MRRIICSFMGTALLTAALAAPTAAEAPTYLAVGGCVDGFCCSRATSNPSSTNFLRMFSTV